MCQAGDSLPLVLKEERIRKSFCIGVRNGTRGSISPRIFRTVLFGFAFNFERSGKKLEISGELI
jgi:hypothetical protein